MARWGRVLLDSHAAYLHSAQVLVSMRRRANQRLGATRFVAFASRVTLASKACWSGVRVLGPGPPSAADRRLPVGEYGPLLCHGAGR